jgi:hypothetical protein
VSDFLTVEQQFLVGPGETRISELEKVVQVIAGKPEDPGFLQPASKRVAMVVEYLEAHQGSEELCVDESHEELIAHVDLLKDLVAFKPGDPGPPYPTHERVIAVFTELEKRLARANLTLESIGRAEGV